LANDRQSGRINIVEDDDDSQMIKKIQPVADLSLIFSQVLEDERLVGPMREFMGDEPKLMEEKLNYKQPLTEPVADLETNRPTEAWPVHSDWAYYQQQDYPKGTISSAIALDDLTEENGTMR